MKRKLFSLLCTILMMAFFAPIAVPTFAAPDYRMGENLIINGDFEEGLNGSQVPNGWSVYDTMTTSSVLVKGENYKLTEDWKASGNTSYFVDKTNDTNNGTLYIYQVIPKEKLIPGASYVLHIEGRTQDGTDTTAKYGMCLGYISDLGGAYNGGSMINYDVRPLNRTTQTNGEYWVHEGGFVYDGENDIALSLWNQDRGKVWWDNISIYQVKRSLESREDFQRYTEANIQQSLVASKLIDRYTNLGEHFEREVEADGNVALRMKARANGGLLKAVHLNLKNTENMTGYKIDFRVKLLIPESAKSDPSKTIQPDYTIGLYYTNGSDSVYGYGIVLPTEVCQNKWVNVELWLTGKNATSATMSLRMIDVTHIDDAYAPDFLVDDITIGKGLYSHASSGKTISYHSDLSEALKGNRIAHRVSEPSVAYTTAETLSTVAYFVAGETTDTAKMITTLYAKDGDNLTFVDFAIADLDGTSLAGKTDITLSELAPGAYVAKTYLWDVFTGLQPMMHKEAQAFTLTAAE